MGSTSYLTQLHENSLFNHQLRFRIWTKFGTVSLSDSEWFAEKMQLEKDKVFDIVKDAVIRGDADFFERVVQAMRIVGANKEKGLKGEYGIRYDRAVDMKGAAIVQFLLDHGDAMPEEKVSSSKIADHLLIILAEFHDAIDEAEVRRICRQIGIKLPFIPGSIPRF